MQTVTEILNLQWNVNIDKLWEHALVHNPVWSHFTSVFCSALSGGRQTGLPQHLQDHGLRGLLQVSPVGETAGESINSTVCCVICACMLSDAVIICIVSLSSSDSGIRNIPQDFVLRATDWSSAHVQRAATQFPAQPTGDRLPAQRLREVRQSVSVYDHTFMSDLRSCIYRTSSWNVPQDFHERQRAEELQIAACRGAVTTTWTLLSLVLLKGLRGTHVKRDHLWNC